MRWSMWHLLKGLGALAGALAIFATSLAAANADQAGADLEAADQSWLKSVELLITDVEREAFLGLERDYQKASFIRRFWQERDPFPETRLNEFEEEWKLRSEIASSQFGNLDGERSEVLLLIGPPARLHDSPCPERFVTASFWEYQGTAAGRFFVLFVRGGRDGFRVWSRLEGSNGLLPFGSDLTEREIQRPEDPLDRVTRACGREREIREMLEASLDLRQIRQRADLPVPSEEWVPSFLGRLTTVPDGADSLEAEFMLGYPGRRQSRTIVQALVALDLGDTDRARHFVVDGEVLKQGEPFDSFRYRFDFPAQPTDGGAAPTKAPLVVQRYLRPGPYILVLRVQELGTDRFFRIEREIAVPHLRIGENAVQASELAPEPAPESQRTPEELAQFAEANEAIPEQEHRVRILPPPRELLLGRNRVEAIASGDEVYKVTFALNGRTILSKLRPPFSVELNLGEIPRLHTLEAIAYNKEGEELARDRAEINSGPHRFGVRLIQPAPSRQYRSSLRIEAEVDLPTDETLDRVELYLGEERLATLYQPPFVQPILLPEVRDLSYVRAVAFLADGNSTEDLVFINSPDHLDALEVDFVELYTSVVDREGHPVEGVESTEFTVLEDGVEQRVRRFERVRDLPIHAGVLVDTSTSMEHSLEDVEKAALRFFERIVQPRDRAAVIVFNDFPELRVPLTNSLEVLAGGLADLETDGETALYDSLIYGLYYFSGIRGKRALILLSDGADSNSQHNFDETLDFARRSGVAVYTIGLDLDTRDTQARNVLIRVAQETGGRSFFVGHSSQLERIYDSIEEELRSQYLIGYQSTQTGDAGFREIAVTVDRPDLEAKTIPGYYP